MYGGGGGLMGSVGGMMGGGGGHYLDSAPMICVGESEEPVVFVYNIGPTTTEIDLYGLCGPYGAITKVDIAKHKDGNSRGFGFVTFASFEDGARVVAALDGHQYEKNGFKTLSVSFKTKKSDDKSGGDKSGGAKFEKKATPLLQSPAPSLMGSGPAAGAGGFSAFNSSYSMPGGGGGGGAYAYSSSYPGMDYDQAPSSSATGDFQIFIYNIGDETSDLDIYSLCSPYGPVSKVNVVKDKETEKPKGFAFVTFKDYDAALGAIQYLNGHPYPKNKYRKLQVSFKTEKKTK